MENRKFHQLHIRHLLIAMSFLAVLAALCAPWIREMTREGHLALVIQLVLIFGAGAWGLVFAFRLRQRIERLAGPVKFVVQKPSARSIHFLFISLMLLALVWAGWQRAHLAITQKSALTFALSVFDPMLIFWATMGVNYLVVKVWWGLTPLPSKHGMAGL